MSIHVIHAGNGLHLCAISGVRSPCLYYNYIHTLYEPIHKLFVTTCPIIKCITIRTYLFQLASSIWCRVRFKLGLRFMPVAAPFLAHLDQVQSVGLRIICSPCDPLSCKSRPMRTWTKESCLYMYSVYTHIESQIPSCSCTDPKVTVEKDHRVENT